MKTKVSYLLCLTLLICSCAPNANQDLNISKNGPIKGLVNYKFSSPAWITDQTIAFIGKPIMTDRKSRSSLLLYNTQTSTWKVVDFPISDRCDVEGYTFLSRLPNNNLGAVKICVKGISETRTIVEFSVNGENEKILVNRTSTIGILGKFAFSPDMGKVVVEDMTNRFLGNKIYLYTNENFINIQNSFTRAMYPDWSGTINKIAFWGTENYPGGSPETLSTLPEIMSLSSYPWDLYISNSDGTQTIKLLTGVVDALQIKWSPADHLIAFSGTVNGQSGLFILDANIPEHPYVVWENLVDFDWSPNGKNIILIDNKQNDIVMYILGLESLFLQKE